MPLSFAHPDARRCQHYGYPAIWLRSSRMRQALDKLLCSAGLDALDDEVRSDLLRFVALLSKWNRVWNLTAVRDPAEMVSRHIVDSLSLLSYIDEVLAGQGDATVSAADIDLLDIGSGAGLPVLPLAIVRRGLRCLSVERTTKKARFQQQVVLELKLQGVQVRSERIQEVQAQASIVTSRAFTAPEDFLRLAAGYTTEGGVAMVMLGRAERMPDRLPAGWQLRTLERVSAPASDAERHIAVCVMRGA